MTENREVRMGDQLYDLTIAQAREVLETFLKTEKEHFSEWAMDSVVLDYSPLSVVQMLRQIATEIMAGRLENEQHSLWFMRLGYYFGESLRHANSNLNWGLGDPEYAFANHPVIAGFKNEQEAAVINISKNLIMAVVKGLSPITRIDDGVKHWFEAATE